MKSPRSNHGMVNYNGRIWVIGGTNGQQPTYDVESYSVLEKQEVWKEEACLNEARSCAVTVVHSEKIWVIGGRDRFGNIVKTVEIYDCK